MNGPGFSRRGVIRWISHNRAYIFVLIIVVVFFHAGLLAGHKGHPDEFSYTNPHSRSRASLNSSTSKSSFLSFFGWSSAEEPLEDNEELKKLHELGARIVGVPAHPIERLMEEAEEKFKAKMARQSKTLKEAVVEYTRRYGRKPPKGFDDWWKFAMDNEVKMVDEYDGLVDDLEPFWDLSGEELRSRTLEVAGLPSIDMVRVRDGKATTVHLEHGFTDSEVSARANGFKSMLGKFVARLPDMDFPINAKAEGRVIVPWEHRMYPNISTVDPSQNIRLDDTFQPDWGSNGNVWEAWRRTCPPNTPARRQLSSLRTLSLSHSINYFEDSSSVAPKPARHNADFNFITSPSSQTLDYCQNPHAHYTQGHFFSDWRTISRLYPVFSPGRAQGFMDIRIPSHYYYGSTSRYTYGWDPVNLELKDVDDMEVPWEKKKDIIFWRGASTGGGNHPPGFSPQYQRHRFVQMITDTSVPASPETPNVTLTFPLPASVNPFPTPPSSTLNQQLLLQLALPISELNAEIMDVAFVKAIAASSYPGGLDAMMRDHRFADAVPLGKHWEYKYLVDLDGMGYSGRFMAFLASDSVPVKATVYEEFFEHWIQPWVHYIPMSTSYREIYNIYSYFTGPPKAALVAVNSTEADVPLDERRSVEGDRRLRRIARAGKQWKRTIGRKIDMEVYVYRLSLEWARLWADDRDAMSFEL